MHETDEKPDKTEAENQFAEQAEYAEIGFLAEFWMFLRDNKKWWLIPLISSLLLIGAISLLAATGAAPFIYTVF